MSSEELTKADLDLIWQVLDEEGEKLANRRNIFGKEITERLERVETLTQKVFRILSIK